MQLSAIKPLNDVLRVLAVVMEPDVFNAVVMK